MALKIENISPGKVIGIGPETILPGESKIVPKAYENNPVLSIYEKKGFARVTKTETEQVSAAENADTRSDETDAGEAAEALRKARLLSLKGISDEELGKLAFDLGINPADCKNNADVLKKVKAALKA